MKHIINKFIFISVLALLTATTAWAGDVTLREDNDFGVGTAGHWYVNMPATGSNTLTLSDATITTFKVYDDGGKGSNYRNNCDGYLTLTAPTGYVLQLSGNIMTEKTYDKLTVYDGSSASATKLLDAVSSTSDGTATAIGRVISTGQSMTLYFSSDNGWPYAGLDLTVTLIDTNTLYNITVSNPLTGGNVAANKTKAMENETITLTATPESGYVLSGISVTDESSNAVAVTGGTWYDNTATFTMPNSAVTVTPTFTNDLTSLSVNMPKTDTKAVTLPANVQSFKVYDDGGAGGNYSNSCSGYLTLTAPEGYVLQLSGNIMAGTNDYLTVYDGSSASATKLLDAVSSTSDGTATAIGRVISTGQSMTLYFSSDNGWPYAGLDLTVTVVNPNAQHNITVSSATGGSVEATVGGTSASTAKLNDVVTLTATPASGYVLSGISVTFAGSNTVAVTGVTWYNNTATFTMPGSAVTVTPTFTNDLTSLSVNMPKTSTKSVTIPSGVQSFKVYDDGGAGGNYSDLCNGYLTLTAPTGYRLQISGNITTEAGDDKLTVYDGTDNTASTLVNAVSSTSDGTVTAIGHVVSTGQSMMLYFVSNGTNDYAGLDLTVTVVDPNAQYNINGLGAATNGSITADKAQAKVNETVTLTATPANGHVLSGISIIDASSNAVAVTGGTWYDNTATFTMPGSAVTVIPTFTNNLTAAGGLYVNMPATDTKAVTIPTGVQSFKVYDDGGAGGNYSDLCNGYLTLTAPEGYRLQLSGRIWAVPQDDYLTVYDGSDNNATKLIDAASSASYNGSETAIPTVTSCGQSMTLHFFSNVFYNSAGLDLTVTLIDTNTQYDITVSNPATGGSVAASVGGTNVTQAKWDDEVTLTATPASGHVLSGISVTDKSSNAVAVTGGTWYNNTATFTMPNSAVTVTPTFNNNPTAAGGLFINMPKTDTKAITIPTGVTSFKVYDDGGAGGNYSNNCDGYLTLTAPEGKRLQLSGRIWTDLQNDYLRVYDGSDNNATKLINFAKSASSGGNETAIPTVYSSGQSLTLYFYSNNDLYYDGLDLTVTLIDTNTQYGITVSNPATGGSVAASIGGTNVTQAKWDDVITLTATPSENYVLDDISVTDESSNAVAVTGGTWYNNTATFTMPNSAVTVTPTFTNTLTNLSVNMPKTGTKLATIPASVTSFKVYDDGGAEVIYSYNCDGYLTLTAPEGKRLQLSGSIMTETDNDKLTVWDNSEASGTKLLDAVSGTRTVSVASSGQSLTLYFYSDFDDRYDGLDLTVTLISTNAEYETLSLTAATIAGKSKYVTTFYNSSLHYRLPAGALAYTVKLNGSSMEFYRIGAESNIIPAGTAVVIVSDKDSVELTRLDTDPGITAGPNDLLGSDLAVDNSSHDKYVLGISGGVLGFYKYSGESIPAGKAYYVAQ